MIRRNSVEALLGDSPVRKAQGQTHRRPFCLAGDNSIGFRTAVFLRIVIYTS